jgi:gamma-glutamyltranspeptidase/glutathione hydrolase
VVVVFGAGALLAETPCRDDRLPPELCTSEARSDHGMVATGSPLATEAAVNILEKGGNAIDAAVAAALTLGVVSSQSSGIGGLTNIVIHLANGRTLAVDGTSYSPMSIDIERFREFKNSGRSFGYETIAVPTALATLEYARSRYGSFDTATLLRPAIEAAEHGYPLSKIQIIKTRKYHDDIMKSSPYMRSLIFEDGRTIGKPGDRHRQPDLAKTLRRIAGEGVRSFYFGGIANEIEADMIRGGGFVRKHDLTRVSVREVLPLHTKYRGFDVYSFPRPGGGAGVVVALNILETYPSDFLAENSAERHHVFLEAFRIAAVDSKKAGGRGRNRRTNPLRKTYAHARAALIVPGKVISEEMLTTSIDPECPRSGESTTQVTVADNLGNVVSLTQTLSRSFGAKVATRGLGFPYNSFLELYAADNPQCPSFLRPNMPITTDMAPTIVLKEGGLFVALGSPGSNKIPPLVSEVISNMVDRGMGVRDAVTAPRVLWGGVPHATASIEVFDPITEEDAAALEQMGFADMTLLRYPPLGKTKMNDFGAVNAVAYDPKTGVFTGVGDPRRFGVAMGPNAHATHE